MRVQKQDQQISGDTPFKKDKKSHVTIKSP